MKKINILLVMAVLFFSACKDFLDVKPTNSGDAGTAIQTAADAKIIMNGLMSKMASGNYYGRNFPLYGDTKGGDLAVYSQGRGYDYLYAFNHSEGSNSYSTIWSQGYHIIAQINNLLESIDALKAAGSNENFDSYKGQALTARAITYFDLVRLYGKTYLDDKTSWGVPNVTTTLPSNAQLLRATVEENYTQILNDLKAAEPLLSKAKANGYINYYANKAMQARVYLYMGQNDLALAAAEEIINSNVYKLYENNEWVGSWASEFGTESIFELAIYPSEGDLGTSSLGAYVRRAGHGSASFLGNFMASDAFIARMNEDPQDVRHGIIARDETSANRMGSWYKYSGSVTLAGDKKTNNSTAVNIKVIRLSEVYLIAAEAALTSNPAKAATYLNAIRKRSPNLAPATAQTVSLDMIADERSKELFGEGHRFFDMIRWNKPITFNDELGNLAITHRNKTIDRSFYKTILPIAIGEINANPGIKAQQNPGY
jgi:hypothetical protein